MIRRCLQELLRQVLAGWLVLSCLSLSGQVISLADHSLEENLPAYSLAGILEFDSPTYRTVHFSLAEDWDDNLYFLLRGDSLVAKRSFNFEKDSLFIVKIICQPIPGEPFEQLVWVPVIDLEGELDSNGFAGPALADRFPTVSEGDYVILAPTVGTDELFTGNGLPQISYPQKIWIRGDDYDDIHLNLDSVSGNSVDERVIISNLEGQVSARKVQLIGGQFWRLTGQYDPELEIGHADFTGCDREGSSVNFGFSSGTYGWDISNSYTSDEVGIQVYGDATGFEIDHLEISDGGFAGLMMKSEDSPNDMDDVYLHHLYIHDVGGEGMYLGSTNEGQQHLISRLTVEHCALLRTGAEALQAGQLGPDCVIRNNVLWGGMHWLSPFNIYQDHGVQIESHSGGNLIENNIILAAGNAFFNVQMTEDPRIQPDGDSLIFRNNLGFQCRGPFGAYMSEESDLVTPVKWERNYFTGFEYEYDRVYLNRLWSDATIRIATKGISVIFRDNILDFSKIRMFELWSGADALIVNFGTHQGEVPPPEFRHLTGEEDDYLRWHHYFDEVGEHPDFPEKNTNKGVPIIYEPGEVVGVAVQGETHYFKCLSPVSQVHPTEDTTGSWQELFWIHDGDTTFTPPDDVRLVPESFFAYKNMGVERSESLPSPFTLTAEDSLKVKWEVVPNPSRGAIRVITPMRKREEVRLFSPAGSLLDQTNLDQNGSAEFDLSRYPSGLYLVTVRKDGGELIRKILHY